MLPFLLVRTAGSREERSGNQPGRVSGSRVTIKTHRSVDVQSDSHVLERVRFRLPNLAKDVATCREERPARDRASRQPEALSISDTVARIAAHMLATARDETADLGLSREDGDVAYARPFGHNEFPGHCFAISPDKEAVILMVVMQAASFKVYPKSHCREVKRQRSGGKIQSSELQEGDTIQLKQGDMLMFDARLVLSVGGTLLEKAPLWAIVVPRKWPIDPEPVDPEIGSEAREVKVIPWYSFEYYIGNSSMP